MTARRSPVLRGGRGDARRDAARAALDVVAWARERVVLDPAARLRRPACRRASGCGVDADATLAALGSAAWLLLLGEDEVATGVGGRRERARRAPATASARRTRGRGSRRSASGCAPRARPVRLAPRAGAVSCSTATLELALATSPAAPGRRLDVDAARRTPATRWRDASTRSRRRVAALAALLAQLARDRTRWRGVRLAAGARSRRARLRARDGLAPAWRGGWPRCSRAYRVVVAHAKLWEWRHAQPAPVREVA